MRWWRRAFPIHTRVREVDPLPVDLVATFAGGEVARWRLVYDSDGLHWVDPSTGYLVTATGGTFTFELPSPAVVIAPIEREG